MTRAPIAIALVLALAGCAHQPGMPMLSECRQDRTLVEWFPHETAYDVGLAWDAREPRGRARSQACGFVYHRVDGVAKVHFVEPQGADDWPRMNVLGHEAAHVACGAFHPPGQIFDIRC